MKEEVEKLWKLEDQEFHYEIVPVNEKLHPWNINNMAA